MGKIELSKDTFLESVNNNLNYWLNVKGERLIDQFENLLKAVHFGFAVKETISASIRLTYRAYHFVEIGLRANEWIGLLTEFVETSSKYIGKVHHLLGLFYFESGDHTEAINYFFEAEKDGISLKDNHLTVAALLSAAQSYWALGELNQSEIFCEKALGCLGDESGLQFAQINNTYGMIKVLQGNYKDAVINFESALDDFKNIGDELGIARALSNLGMTLTAQNEFEKALLMYGQAAGLINKYRKYSELMKIEISRGILHYRLGNTENAELAFRRALPGSEVVTVTPDIKAWLYLVRAYIYWVNGKQEDAEVLFELSSDHWRLANNHEMLALIAQAH